MPYEPNDMALSIRFRLTLWNVLALGVMLTAFSILVYALLRQALYERTDRSLTQELEELKRNPSQDLAHWIHEAKEHQNISCITYDPAGNVAARTEELPEASVGPTPRLQRPRQLLTADVPVIGRQRVLSAPVRVAAGERTVVLFAPLEDVDRELGELLSVLVVAVPVGLLAAGALAYLLASQALAPLHRLRLLTEEITADRLDRRLPVMNPGDELGRMAQTINAMIARLENSFAEIRRFTADASHELRTPLTAIRTETEVALNRGCDNEEYRLLLRSILEECERLTRFTDQLLMLSREDAGVAQPAVETVDLSALVERVVETMRPLAEAKRLDVSVAAKRPLCVRGDEVRLRQVFYNLLDNAIKYTPEGGKIELQLTRHQRHVRIVLRDTGIGIPAEHLPRVFDRFYRVDPSRSRDHGGTGLGLSIARTIITTHGGRIELTSIPSQGTTCTILLSEATDLAAS